MKQLLRIIHKNIIRFLNNYIVFGIINYNL